jgi:dTDP-4-amino-4,6-dideoxygalactose transaminase
MIKFLDLGKQYQSIKAEVDNAIGSVIAETSFIGGKYVKCFEGEFANFIGVKHCVGVGNGTDALEIAIEALDLPQGSEIIVPANSFIASAEAVTRCGHRVVFADVCEDSYILDISDISRRITSNTSAIMAVHLYGHPCDMGGLAELAERYNLYIIEDCAQAHGAKYKQKVVGGLGNIAAFSFYPGKNLGAYGDGGAITTNDEDLAVKVKMIANHGRIAKYDHAFEGRNSRLDGLQAAILSVKLKFLNVWTEHRIKIADCYLNSLKDQSCIVLPVRQKWATQVYHLFVIRVPHRDQLKQYLYDNGVESGIHYPVALPKLGAYGYVNQQSEDLFANCSDQSLLSLPIGDHITVEEIDEITSLIKMFYKSRNI